MIAIMKWIDVYQNQQLEIIDFFHHYFTQQP